MEDYDIAEAFKRIEEELMADMIRNLDHHRAMEETEGIQWSQWQVEQLRALEVYKKRNAKKYGTQFEDINKHINALIYLAREQGGMDQEIRILEAVKKGFTNYHKPAKTSSGVDGVFFRTNDRKMDALIEATTNDFKKAEYAMLRRSNDQYRKIIFNAQVYANIGGTTYEKAIDMATKDFLKAGIQCIEYKNGARHTLSEYSRMCIKTATTRAYLTGEGEKRKEWGVSTVIMNKRGNPCPKCAPWCGKVMIDDVWSGGKPDGKHPLISTAIEQGLYHPNCKDMHTTYFPGVSTADDPYTREEKKQIVADYNREQKVNYAKNQAEKYERLSQLSLDPDNKKMYAARAAEWEKKGQNNNVSDNKTKRSAKDVTDRWIKEATPNSHEVIDLKEYVVNGITHVVDNKNIVLDYSSKERRIAELLEGTFGGEVKMVPRVLNPERVSTPDYLYKGEPFDLKEIKGTSKNVIYNAISKKKRQASNFILDITECPLDRDEINRQVGDIYRSTHTRFVDKIIIVDNNEVIQVYQREI